MVLLQTPVRGNTARVEFERRPSREQVKRLMQYLDLCVDSVPSEQGFQLSDKAKQGLEVIALHFNRAEG